MTVNTAERCDVTMRQWRIQGGAKGAMAPPPKRQKSPFALMNYSFTVANDVNLCLLSIQYTSHSIVTKVTDIGAN